MRVGHRRKTEAEVCWSFQKLGTLAFWNSLLNVLGSAGYVAQWAAIFMVNEEEVFGYSQRFITLVLAFIVLVDSLLSLSLSLRGPAGPQPFFPDLAAALLNVVGSIIYGVTAVMTDEGYILLLEYIAALIFLIDSVLYCMPWYEDAGKKIDSGEKKRRGSSSPLSIRRHHGDIHKTGKRKKEQAWEWKTLLSSLTSFPFLRILASEALSLEFWEHALNILPSLLYVLAGTLGLWLFVLQRGQDFYLWYLLNYRCTSRGRPRSRLSLSTLVQGAGEGREKGSRRQRCFFSRGEKTVTNVILYAETLQALNLWVYVLADTLWLLDAFLIMQSSIQSAREEEREVGKRRGQVERKKEPTDGSLKADTLHLFPIALDSQQRDGKEDFRLSLSLFHHEEDNTVAARTRKRPVQQAPELSRSSWPRYETVGAPSLPIPYQPQGTLALSPPSLFT